MTIQVSPVPLEDVLGLRELYRQEMNCQIIHDSLPGPGFGNLFQFRIDGRVAGYGFVMGYQGEPKDLIRGSTSCLRIGGGPQAVPPTGRDQRGNAD